MLTIHNNTYQNSSASSKITGHRAMTAREGGIDAELLVPEFHPGSVDAGLDLSADYRQVLPSDLVAQRPGGVWREEP